MVTKGTYSTITVAIFGIPLSALPSSQFSVTTSNASIPATTSPITSGNPAIPLLASRTTPISRPTSETPAKVIIDFFLYQEPNDFHENLNLIKQAELSSPSSQESKQLEPPVKASACIHNEPVGLYEDGEIQDIDYEEISSNEDLFSDMEEEELSEKQTRNQASDINERTTEFAELNWKFEVSELFSLENAQLFEKMRLTDPTLTIFQVANLFCFYPNICYSGLNTST
ncbi:unnamed protein product [Protopolystoma xenopodis]|uniref:Uncharacterized protein n=1 Tax=Protopolystoma xenopodis TaxID=117903 RepID=A0A3S5A6L4_9PLAT|nr:unnamed protein product [Protopolystoma xenopodis]